MFLSFSCHSYLLFLQHSYSNLKASTSPCVISHFCLRFWIYESAYFALPLLKADYSARYSVPITTFLSLFSIYFSKLISAKFSFSCIIKARLSLTFMSVSVTYCLISPSCSFLCNLARRRVYALRLAAAIVDRYHLCMKTILSLYCWQQLRARCCLLLKYFLLFFYQFCCLIWVMMCELLGVFIPLVIILNEISASQQMVAEREQMIRFIILLQALVVDY